MSEGTALTEAGYYILLSLYTPRHGYGIMQRTEELSGGRVRLAAGTLYGALNTMLDKEWIAPAMADNNRRKCYQLTEKGLCVLKEEQLRLEKLAEDGRRVFKGEV